MLETVSSIAFFVIIIILVAVFAPQYIGWVIGAIASGILFRLMDKK